MSIGLLAGAAMGRGVIDFNHHDNIAGWIRSVASSDSRGLAGWVDLPSPAINRL